MAHVTLLNTIPFPVLIPIVGKIITLQITNSINISVLRFGTFVALLVALGNVVEE